MAKNKVYIDVVVDDKGTTKRVAVNAKKLGNALDDAGASQNKYQKQQKGVAGATSNTTKAFSKMTTGISGGLVPAYATLAANVFALSAAFNYLKSAGSLKQLMEGQVAYSSATGKGMISLARNLQLATDAQLSYQEASQAGAIGVAAGLNIQQVTQLGKAARDTSAVLGRDLTDSFNRLVRGITKAEPELLDELGIILRLENATQNYMRVMNIQGRQLTINEKSQAVFLETITQVNEKYGELVDGIDPNAWQVLGVELTKINDTLKLFLTDTLGPIALWFVKNKTVMGLVFAPLVLSITKAMIPGLQNMSGWLKAGGDRLQELSKQAKFTKVAFQGLTAEQAKLQGMQGIAGIMAGTKLGDAASSGKMSSQMVSSYLGQIDKINKGVKSAAINPSLLKLTSKQLKQLELDLLAVASGSYTTKAAADAAAKRLSAMGITASGTGMAVSGLSVALNGLSIALAALNIFFVIASVASLAYTFLKARDAQKEFEEESTAAKFKIDNLAMATRDLKTEFAKFNDTQTKLLEKSGNIVAFFDALANRIMTTSGALSTFTSKTVLTAFSTDLDNYLQGVEAEVDKAVEKLKAETQRGRMGAGPGGGAAYYVSGMQEMEDSAFATYRAELMLNEGAKNFFNTITDESPASLQVLKDLNEEYQDIDSLLERLPSEISASSEAVNNYRTATAKLNGITVEQIRNQEDVVAFFMEYIKAIQEAEEGIQALGLATTGYLNASKQFSETQSDIMSSVFAPVTSLEAQLNQVQSYLVEYDKIQKQILDNKGEYDSKWLEGERKKQEQALRLVDILKVLTQAERERNIQLGQSKVGLQNSLLGATSGQADLLNKNAALEQAQIQQSYLQIQVETQRLMNDTLMWQGLLTKEERDNLTLKEQALALEDAKIAKLERELDLNSQIFDSANQALESGLQTSIAAIIKGEETSIKDAMLGIAKGMLNAVADTMAKQLTNLIMGTDPLSVAQKQANIIGTGVIEASKTGAEIFYNGIASAIGGFGSTSSMPNVHDFEAGQFVRSIPMTLKQGTGILGTLQKGFNYARDFFQYANGGIMPGGMKEYATGGIVTRPTIGMIGEGRYNEAVVPLPDGKTIPVNMSGAGQNNNVVVNVSIDNNGNATSDTRQSSQSAGNIGNMVAMAVQKELQNQKRSGGILNPYGAA